MRKLILVAAPLLAIALAMPALGGGVSEHIAVQDFSFTPGSLDRAVSSGVIGVSFDNGGNFNHTATSTSGMFGTGTILPTESYVVNVFGAGVYPYRCEFHPDVMEGTFRIRPTASASSIGEGDQVTIRVGGDGFKGIAYDVQRRRNGGDWVLVKEVIFNGTPKFTLQRAGVYEFRARTYFLENRSKWSPVRKVTVS
jgi:plastocyanin